MTDGCSSASSTSPNPGAAVETQSVDTWPGGDTLQVAAAAYKYSLDKLRAGDESAAEAQGRKTLLRAAQFKALNRQSLRIATDILNTCHLIFTREADCEQVFFDAVNLIIDCRAQYGGGTLGDALPTLSKPVRN